MIASFLIISFAVFTVGAYQFFLPSEVKSEPQRHTAPWVYGNVDARFTITEYADLECPYCKDYFPQLKSWVDARPDVNLQLHHLPLSIHEPTASYEAQWAECAGIQGGASAFWMAIELIYQRTHSNGLGVSGTLRLPGQEDRQPEIEECAMNDSDVKQHVRRQASEALQDGITATPTMVVADKTSGRSIKLQGAPDGYVLLSALDWLTRKSD